MKIILILILSVSLVGCGNNQETSKETCIISGTISDMNHMNDITYLTVETENGIKVPLYEVHSRFSDSSFSNGAEIGDKVRFEIKKVEASGYKIIGIDFQ